MKTIRVNPAPTAQLLVVVAVVFLACCAAARSVDHPPTNLEKKDTAVSAAVDNVVRKGLSRRFMGHFDTSLEMRENVDFLLAPALLVQNAISRDVVITYPSE
jgi:hypothetical protein